MSITIQAADSSAPQAVAARTVAVRAAPAEPAQPRAAAQEERKQVQVDPQEMRKALQEAVERLNDNMRKMSRNLAFSIDDKANRTVITVTNSTTGEVVRQIPNETVLEVSRSIEDFKGLLHNTVS